MPYGIGQPEPEETDIVEYDQQEHEMTMAEKAEYERERNMRMVEAFNARRRDISSDSSTQVREVLYDTPVPEKLYTGGFERAFGYLATKASRIPSLSAVDQKRRNQEFHQISDILDSDQMAPVIQSKLVRMIYSQEMDVSRTDRKSSSESGISSITIQKQSSDYRVTNNSPQINRSIFDGIGELFGKKKKE